MFASQPALFLPGFGRGERWDTGNPGACGQFAGSCDPAPAVIAAAQ